MSAGRRLVALFIVALGILAAVPTLQSIDAPAAHADARGDNIARIAKSQLGRGPYDPGYYTSITGEPWCADFAKWVWARAGVNVNGLNAAAASFVHYGQRNGTLVNRPQVGDAVVFGYNGSNWAEHVALVTAVRADGSLEITNGNYGNRVAISNAPARAGIGTYVGGQRITNFIRPAGSGVNNGGGARVSTPQNCPSGYVCIYPGTSFTDQPIARYYNYAPYNFSNMYGNKLVYNNQYGGAKVNMHAAYNGKGNILVHIPAGQWKVVNMTPVNSMWVFA